MAETAAALSERLCARAPPDHADWKAKWEEACKLWNEKNDDGTYPLSDEKVAWIKEQLGVTGYQGGPSMVVFDALDLFASDGKLVSLMVNDPANPNRATVAAENVYSLVGILNRLPNINERDWAVDFVKSLPTFDALFSGETEFPPDEDVNRFRRVARLPNAHPFARCAEMRAEMHVEVMYLNDRLPNQTGQVVVVDVFAPPGDRKAFGRNI